jgi:betaine reductase
MMCRCWRTCSQDWRSSSDRLEGKRGELEREGLDHFERERGLPGFSPTQGHVASAVPWLPHGVEALRSGEIGSTMLLAKGSLFLGRMTELADGMSVLLEQGKE